jgi:hypothetical protein
LQVAYPEVYKPQAHASMAPAVEKHTLVSHPASAPHQHLKLSKPLLLSCMSCV